MKYLFNLIILSTLLTTNMAFARCCPGPCCPVFPHTSKTELNKIKQKDSTNLLIKQKGTSKNIHKKPER